MIANDEHALIRRAMEGSASAFGVLVTLHQERLYRFLLSRSNSRADAEDAMQEAFIRAFRYLDSYDSRWQFSTWLYRIALRELGKLRSRRDAPGEPDEMNTGQHADPLALCIADDQRQNLWITARQVLGKHAFTTMWLRYAEDMPVKDVARVMGRPATWVRVTLHRARKRLAPGLLAQEDNGGAAGRTEMTREKSKSTRPQDTRRPVRATAIKEHAR